MQNPDEEFVAWATDRGYLNVGRIDRRQKTCLTIKYRLQTGEAIAAPAELSAARSRRWWATRARSSPASRDGYVYAVLEKSGDLLWKFSGGRAHGRAGRGD